MLLTGVCISCSPATRNGSGSTIRNQNGSVHGHAQEYHKTYYDTLDDAGDRGLYQDVLDSLKLAGSGDDSFIDTGVDVVAQEERFERIRHMVLYDHPEYGSVWSRCSMQVSENRKIRADLSGEALDMVPDFVYEDIHIAGGTDRETAWQGFQYFCSVCSYDTEQGPHAHDDYGVMVNGKACCQGAAFAFKRFLGLHGIPCVVLTGYTASGEYHMINSVYLDGVWEWCDLAGALDRDPGPYFCMSDRNREMVLENVLYQPI